jgi:signal transduction histidine kinase
MLPFFVFAACCYLIAPYLGLGSRDVDPRIAELWPPGGVGFVLLTTVWGLGRRTVAATMVFMLATFVVTGVLMGYETPATVWMGLMAVTQSTLMLVLYRRALSHPGWAPETPQEIAALLYAAVGSSLVIGVAGGFPFLDTGHAFSEVLLWWVLRNTVFCFVGAATFMVIFFQRREEVLRPSPWFNRVGLLAVSVICVYGTYLDPTLPLSWLLMIPCVWGGLTLTIRGTAYLALTVALCAAAMTYLPQNQFGYTGFLPAASIVDLLVIASVAFAFLLTLMRDQRARLISELDGKRAEAEAQRQVLETIFESMNDGVMIADETGVTKYNQAARRLLGKPIPLGRPHSWVEAYQLTGTEGRGLSDEELRTALFVGASGLGTSALEVVVGGDAGAKVLDVSAKALGEENRGSRLVLLHDSTDQRARVRELTNFAGMVAHDLRGPLTVLDGWLEVLEDGSARGTAMADEVAGKAKDASRRMRQVIEDWLGYTVVQNGKPQPEAVKLIDAVSEIFDSRRISTDGEEPIYTQDVDHAVFADPRLLRQLLDNLVGNAVKYTSPEFTPRVHVMSQRDDEPGWIRIEVVDNGIGIPEGEEELIFEEFHRGGAEGRTAGTGLGLALTRRIVAIHGGQLRGQRNAEGGGSTFTFTLPEA